MTQQPDPRPIWRSQLATFIMVGALGAAINAGIYAGLVLAGLHYAIASIVAWVVSLVVGYTLNRRFAFRSKAKISRTLPRVTLVYICQQGLALTGIAALTEIVGLNPIFAYFLMMPPAILFSFVAMRIFAFR
ncbi:MAG: GtrA family protein [Verrucomicrobiaceae bacterium]|nr:MAG: GtrA family protein [Verrucomicrobiaceae bacterium]